MKYHNYMSTREPITQPLNLPTLLFSLMPLPTSPKGDHHLNVMFITLLLLLKTSFVTYVCISALHFLKFWLFYGFQKIM